MPYIALILLCIIAPTAAAQAVRVINGDTLEIGGERTRLWGIDALEGNHYTAASGGVAMMRPRRFALT